MFKIVPIFFPAVVNWLINYHSNLKKIPVNNNSFGTLQQSKVKKNNNILLQYLFAFFFEIL